MGTGVPRVRLAVVVPEGRVLGAIVEFLLASCLWRHFLLVVEAADVVSSITVGIVAPVEAVSTLFPSSLPVPALLEFFRDSEVVVELSILVDGLAGMVLFASWWFSESLWLPAVVSSVSVAGVASGSTVSMPTPPKFPVSAILLSDVGVVGCGVLVFRCSAPLFASSWLSVLF